MLIVTCFLHDVTDVLGETLSQRVNLENVHLIFNQLIQTRIRQNAKVSGKSWVNPRSAYDVLFKAIKILDFQHVGLLPFLTPLTEFLQLPETAKNNGTQLNLKRTESNAKSQPRNTEEGGGIFG